LIVAQDLNQFEEALHLTFRRGLPSGIFALLIGIAMFVIAGTQLTLAETNKEQLVLLRLTNVSQSAIIWSFVVGIIYRTRYWLILIVGVFPVFLWIICGWSIFGAFGTRESQVCYLSPFGNTYCYLDSPDEFANWVEFLWFLSLTISVIGFGILAALCSVGVTLKIKNAVLAAVPVLAISIPIIIVLVLELAPEGFLLIDTFHKSTAISAPYGPILGIGLVMAVLPIIALLGVQYLLREWAFS
jgi:hypothetical protein